MCVPISAFVFEFRCAEFCRPTAQSDAADPFKDFWHVVEGMLDKFSNPVAFATAPLSPPPPAAARPTLVFSSESESSEPEDIAALAGRPGPRVADRDQAGVLASLADALGAESNELNGSLSSTIKPGTLKGKFGMAASVMAQEVFADDDGEPDLFDAYSSSADTMPQPCRQRFERLVPHDPSCPFGQVSPGRECTLEGAGEGGRSQTRHRSTTHQNARRTGTATTRRTPHGTQSGESLIFDVVRVRSPESLAYVGRSDATQARGIGHITGSDRQPQDWILVAVHANRQSW